MERKHNSAAKLPFLFRFFLCYNSAGFSRKHMKRSTTARAEKATGKLSAWGKSMDLVDLREYIL